jgi:hypothetical protein
MIMPKYFLIKNLFLVSALFTLHITVASTGFPVSQIPEAIKTDANVIYRTFNKTVKINNPGNYSVLVEEVITVLNENGKKYSVLIMPYDSHSRPQFMSGEIFDAAGKSIRKIKSSDLVDMSYFQGFSLYEDNRIRGFEPTINHYPYTVRYVYEITYSAGMFYALKFYPHQHVHAGVQDARLVIEYPQNMQIIFKLINISEEPGRSELRNRNIFTWTFNNLSPVISEFRSPEFDAIAPGIIFSTDKYVFDGYAGQNNSWQDFGKWIWELNKGRDHLPASRVAHLQTLTQGLQSDREKVKVVYEFMQSHTRYVNVSVGIGGFQPQSAEMVDRVGYGDCKALSNYMKAMLKTIGIPSFYTLVYAGEGHYHHVREDFPVSQFNHVILCVPLGNDTIWLECTSQISPFGFLGDFTDNRAVLIIREDGGFLARTPGYSRQQNTRTTYSHLTIEPNGNAKAKIRTGRTGIFYSDYMRLARIAPDDQKKSLYEYFTYPNYTIGNFSINNQISDNPQTIIEMEINLRSFATVSGERLTIPLARMASESRVPVRIRNRKYPLELKYDYIVCDTISFELPAGFVLEAALQDLHFESEFGKFVRTVKINGNKGIMIRMLEVWAGLHEPDKYGNYYNFYQSIVRAENQALVLRKE